MAIERRVGLQRRAQRLAPTVQLGFALAEQPADQALERLRQRRIRDVALVLVELARREQAARRHERLVQLVDHRGLADAGIAGDQHQLGRARRHHPLERLEQPPDLRLASVELFGDAQDVGDVVGAERERRDGSGRLPFGQAALQVVRQAGGGLVAILGRLGEALHHHRRDRLGQAGDARVRRRRRARDMGVDPLHRVAGAERQDAGEHLVEDDAHGVEIAAGVDRAVHPAGLFGRHVGERAGRELDLVGRGVFARRARGEAEAGEVDGVAARLVHQNIGRPEILVDQPARVDLADGFDELDRQAQGARRLHRPAQQLGQRNAAGILQHQQGAPALAHQLQGPGGPGGVEVVLQRVFVEEAVDRGGRRRVEGRGHRQHALLPLTPSPATIEREGRRPPARASTAQARGPRVPI